MAARSRPRRWGVDVVVRGSTEVVREGSGDYDGDDTRQDNWVESASPALEGEGTVVAAFEPKEGAKDHLVLVRYSTGDSFHRDGGLMEVAAVFEDERLARWAAAMIEASPDAYSVGFLCEDGSCMKVSCPWSGYFESIESVEVLGIELGPAPSGRPSGRARARR